MNLWVKLIFPMIAAMLISPHAFALSTRWSWSFSGQTMVSGTGTFTGYEEVTNTNVSGTYVHEASGAMILTMTGGDLPFGTKVTAYQLADTTLIMGPLAPGETEISVHAGRSTCPPPEDILANFNFSQWNSGHDLSNPFQPAIGTMSFVVNTGIGAINQLWSLGNLSAALPIPNPAMTFTGVCESDGNGGQRMRVGNGNQGSRSGLLYFTNANSANPMSRMMLFKTDAQQLVLGIIAYAIPHARYLWGRYVGFMSDVNARTVVPVHMTIGETNSSAVGGILSDPADADSFINGDQEIQFVVDNENDLNKPRPGMVKGVFTHNGFSGNGVCTPMLGTGGKNFLSCTFQAATADSRKSPINIMAVSMESTWIVFDDGAIYTYGTLASDQFADKVFTLHNPGAVSGLVESAVFEREGFEFAGGVFPGEGGTCESLPFTLGAGQSCTIKVRFSPNGALGRMYDVLKVSYQTSIMTRQAQISVRGVSQSAAVLSLAPSDAGQIRFPDAIVDSGRAMTVTASNTGSHEARNIAMVLSGDWHYAGGSFPGTGGTCGTTLPGLAKCSLVIEFDPQNGPSSHGQSFDLTYFNGADNVTIAYYFYGDSHTAPDVTFNAVSHDFGNVASGGRAIQQFVMTNNSVMAITNVQFSSGADLAFHFPSASNLGGSCRNGMTLEPGLTCSLKVYYDSTAGAHSGVLKADFNAGVTVFSTPNVNLTGTGVSGAFVELHDGGIYNFGSQSITASNPLDHSFALKNVGDGNATNMSFDAWPASSAFNWKGGNYPGEGGTCGTTLNAGQTCYVVVAFAPEFVQTYRANPTLTYDSGAGTNTWSVQLDGYGTQATKLIVAAQSPVTTGINYWSFGSTIVGEETSQTFYVSNAGQGGVTSLSATVSGKFRFKGSNYPGTGGNCGSGLAASATCAIVVEFAPDAERQENGKLNIAWTQGIAAGSTNVALAGTGKSTGQGESDEDFGSSGLARPAPAGGNELGMHVTVDSQSRVLVSGFKDTTGLVRQGFIYRFTPEGDLDTNFYGTGRIGDTILNGYALSDVVVSSTGRVIAAGPKKDSASFIVAAFTNLGVLDGSFSGADGTAGFIELPGNCATVQLKKLYDNSMFVNCVGLTANKVFKVKADGGLDTINSQVFAAQDFLVNALLLGKGDGLFLLGGISPEVGTAKLVKINADGQFSGDMGFGNSGTDGNYYAYDVFNKYYPAHAMVQRPDDNINLVHGAFQMGRFTPDGTEITFGSQSAAPTSASLTNVVDAEILKDGRVISLLVDPATSVRVTSALPSGAVDNAFGTNGIMNFAGVISGPAFADLAVDPNNGSIYVVSPTFDSQIGSTRGFDLRKVTANSKAYTHAYLSFDADDQYVFTNAPQGQTTTVDLKVRNLGTRAATSVAIATSPDGPFQVVALGSGNVSDECGAMIVAGASCVIQVRYTPTTQSAHASVLALSYNDGVTTQQVSLGLSGNAIANGPALQITGGPGVASGPADFGLVTLGSSSNLNGYIVVHQFTLTNAGNMDASYQVSANNFSAPFSFPGGFPGTFGVLSGTCNGWLAAGQSCTFLVKFEALETRTFNDEIEFEYQDGNGQTQTVYRALSATGITPASASFNVSEYDFGQVKIGDTAEATLTVSTSSMSAYLQTLSYLVLKVGFDPDSPFQFKGGFFPGTGGTCGSTVAQGCTIVITFAPMYEDNFERNPLFDFSHSDEDVQLKVKGSVVAWNGASLNFSSGAFGVRNTSIARRKTITAYNLGGAPLTEFQVHDLIGANFRFAGGSFPGTNGTCGATLGVGENCTLVLEYFGSGSNGDLQTGKLGIAYLDGSIYRVTWLDLSGEVGPPADLQMGGYRTDDPPPHTRYLYHAGDPRRWPIERPQNTHFYGLKNIGLGTAKNIHAIFTGSIGPNFGGIGQVAHAHPICGGSLAPNETCTFDVRFNPVPRQKWNAFGWFGSAQDFIPEWEDAWFGNEFVHDMLVAWDSGGGFLLNASTLQPSEFSNTVNYMGVTAAVAACPPENEMCAFNPNVLSDNEETSLDDDNASVTVSSATGPLYDGNSVVISVYNDGPAQVEDVSVESEGNPAFNISTTCPSVLPRGAACMITIGNPGILLVEWELWWIRWRLKANNRKKVPIRIRWNGNNAGPNALMPWFVVNAGGPAPAGPGADGDYDYVPDSGDNCPSVGNPSQADTDGDGMGDACDPNPSGSSNPSGSPTPTGSGLPDMDGDGVPDAIDNCASVANADQADSNSNDIGDACDDPDPTGSSGPSGSPNPTDTGSPTDTDGDGVLDGDDNCPSDSNAGQQDTDGDGLGNACDATPFGGDPDGDGVPEFYPDNCPNVNNPDQADSDEDGIGDACEISDGDGDGIADGSDNCPLHFNSGQENFDGDALGDICDPTMYGNDDTDNDLILNGSDNCPNDSNNGQEDSDSDGIGDVCDPDPTESPIDPTGSPQPSGA